MTSFVKNRNCSLVECYEDLEALISKTESELQEMDEARNVFRNKMKCAVRPGDENLRNEIRGDIALLLPL